MSIKNSYGVGILGAGVISHQYLTFAPLFADFELRGIADLVPERAAGRSRDFGVPALTPEALLADPSIDVVISLTQPQQHFGALMAALEAGKHAYTEKPFALSRAQGELLRRTAEAKGLRVGGAPDTFLGGSHQQARQLVDAGRIGKVTAGTAVVMGAGMENWHPRSVLLLPARRQPGCSTSARTTSPTSSTSSARSSASPPSATRRARSGRSPSGLAAHGRNHPCQRADDGARRAGVRERRGHYAAGELGGLQHATATAPLELYGTEGSLFVPDPNFFGGSNVIAARTA